MPLIFDLLEHEGLCMGGSTGDQCRGRDPARQGHGAGPHHRHDSRATTARAISRSCSIRTSCAPRTCRCRHGWSAGRTSNRRSCSDVVIRAASDPVNASIRRMTGSGFWIPRCAGMPIERPMPTDCLFREDAYLTDARHRGRPDRGGRHRARPHRASTPPRADSRATAACWSRRAGEISARERDLHRSAQDRDRASAGRGVERAARARRARARARSTGTCAMPHAHAHRAASALGRAALSGDRRRGRRERQPARLRHSRGRPRQGRDHREARRDDRGRRRGALALDHRRGARSQSRPGQDHVGEAADGHRPRAADRDRRATTCSPAAAPMCAAPTRSAPCA